ncbi:MAG: DUF4105 domain-containing protein [Deltaproteobacteria bacterium]|nr:DUF4105 domain-containing protein [Deltaproteobacteria bacterium]
MRGAALALALLALATTWRGAHAEPMVPSLDDRTAALARALTPPLASVLSPLPRMRGADRADKLAFMAELGWRLDARHRFSDMPAWRVIMGWPEPLDTLFTWDRSADDRSPARYPHPAGQHDPALDFAASVAVGWIDPDTLSCRFPLRARFLLRHGLIRGPLALDEGRCAVDRWADWPRVDGVEVIYVTPSWDDPSASMGHVIFRVRHRHDERVTGDNFAPSFAYSAIDDPETTPNYLLRGILGGLTASMKLETFGDVYRRYAVDERRDLVLYDLVLSREELHDLLAEAHRQRHDEMAVPYRFFSVNCASLAWDLVRAVVPSLPERSSLMTHPHEVVSGLIAAGRARPRGIIRAQRTRAAEAEARQDALAPALARVPGFPALHAARWSPPEARAAALGTFAALDPTAALAITSRGPRDDATLAALTEYVDLVIDVEAQAIVQRDGAFDPAATSAPLEAALDLRATLPIRPDVREAPFPPWRIGPSGSRHVQLSTGVSDAGRLEAAVTVAVLDEEAGEARAVSLRRSGRNVVMRSETRISTDGAGAPVVESEELTLLEIASWGVGPRTDRSWLASRMGFVASFGSESWPREGMPFALLLRGGPGLTLVASDDFAAHLVVGADVVLETWAIDAARFRGGVGAFVEAALPLGSAENRVRVNARLRPTWAWDDGFGLGVEIDGGLDLTLDPQAGLVLRPMLTWRHGLPAGNGLRFGLALAW